MAFTGALLLSTAVVGTSAYDAHKAAKTQEAAQKVAAKQAEQASLASERANNRANAKVPDLVSLARANANASGGAGSTMLTGASGIDPNKMLLGKSTLLGS